MTRFIKNLEKIVANVAHVLAVNFTCEICNKSFSSKAALSRHLKVHQDTVKTEKQIKVEPSPEVPSLNEQSTENVKTEGEENSTVVNKKTNTILLSLDGDHALFSLRFLLGRLSPISV
jgi:uncharacterized Zn-finger protein